jgi:hypothetical protein
MSDPKEFIPFRLEENVENEVFTEYCQTYLVYY